ncbi:ABC transporter permease subunit [Corticibacter populi]|uniref:ABC transporter permease subunit n=1 Tax=Corticibacter populi TaxID=1550736 RepID=A0A3M6QS42_9BURK|nr:ABC transporter permease subunit [Corticibacter populi]RMX05803.1 ABC transporter permease subunit [Corticibacter populi]RZS30887.1 putrescine transport system permease protein [Corticibacter populi]
MQAGGGEKALGRLWLLLVFAFLYLPIVALVVFSFTDSPVPNVWAGFSLRWYEKLWADTDLQRGLLRSLQLAACSATAATILGTLAAVSLHHMRRHLGRSFYSALLRAPLVMPEVLVGLSLLLLLVSLQRAFGYPERGLLTIWIGHVLIGLAYATVVIVARLRDLNPQLEEAAQDLGARPAQVFFLVTLPNIGQALMAAWLLTFTLSLDDVVIAAFLSGPGSTTMPLMIFSRARLGLDPTVNALATVVIVVVAVFVTVASYMMAARERRRRAEQARG